MLKITNLRPDWGAVITDTTGKLNIDEILERGSDYWSDIGYTYDLLLFRGLGKISDENIVRLAECFGTLWPYEEYFESRESPYKLMVDGQEKALTKYSNLISKRLGQGHMEWHSDISNKGIRSFPWRLLYNKSNPNPNAGITSYLNVRLDLINPTDEERNLFERMEVINQSWYNAGENILKQDFIKIHPLTGVESLRTNYFVDPRRPRETESAWLKNILIDGVEHNNYEVIGGLHKKLSNRPELIYAHQWQVYDFIIYDNYNFLHKRTACELKPGEERFFIRANVAHLL